MATGESLTKACLRLSFALHELGRVMVRPIAYAVITIPWKDEDEENNPR